MALKDIPSGRGRPELDSRKVVRFVMLFAILGICLTSVLSINFPPSRVELHEGDVAPQNIRAQKRVQYVSTIETKTERERATNSVQDVFAFDPGLASQQRNRLAAGLATVSAARSNAALTADAKKTTIKKAFEWDLTDDQVALITRIDENRWQILSANVTRVLYEILSEKVTTERLRDLRNELPARLSAVSGDQERDLSVDLVARMSKVNYSPNPAETARLKKEAQDAVAPVSRTIEKGEIILREGDVVRGTDLEKLEALGLRNPAVDWHAVSSSALISILVVLLLGGYIWIFEPSLLDHERRVLLVALVMLVTLAAAKAVLPGRPYWAYIFPISTVAMLLATLLEARLALVVTVLSGILVAIVANNSLEFMALSVVGAVIGTIGVRRSDRLHNYFIAGGVVALGTFAVILSFRLMSKDDDWAGIALMGGLSVVNGLLASTLSVGTFSLLGRVFGITTTMQLLELSDPTQPLLRRLLNEAPGTYHHSIMVGNLAERAAERVGADSLLVRVGAYYHDVGKLARPYFFIENQLDGRNAHDDLDPQTSARIVATHVRDGLDLAARYGLPARICEFISEHHGTRLVTYFFNQATREGDGPVDVSQYSYQGPRPRSKEAGIVMLADSVEAAVRSASDHSPQKVSALVRRVVDDIAAEGQLDDCDLTLRDLEETKKAFSSILMGMYHPRIEYPPALPPSVIEEEIEQIEAPVENVEQLPS